MGVEERVSLLYKDVLPFAAMVMVEIMLVGGNTLFKSASAQQINSFVFTFYVFLIGFIIFLPYFFIHYRYLSQIFGYIGLKYSSPTLSSIMSNLSPAFTFILAFLFRMEKVHLRTYTSQAKIIGTIVSISGAIIATLYSGPSVLSDSLSLYWIFGGLLLACQYFLLAFTLVAQAKILQVYSVDIMVIFVFGVSGLFVAGLGGLVLARDMDAWKLEPNLVLATVVYMGFSSGFFNVVIQIWILRVKGPVYAAMFKPLTIVIALIMGVMFLGDTLHIGSVLGGSIITIGFYGVVWGKAKEAEDAPPNQTTAPLLEPHDHVLEQGSLIS